MFWFSRLAIGLLQPTPQKQVPAFRNGPRAGAVYCTVAGQKQGRRRRCRISVFCFHCCLLMTTESRAGNPENSHDNTTVGQHNLPFQCPVDGPPFLPGGSGRLCPSVTLPSFDPFFFSSSLSLRSVPLHPRFQSRSGDDRQEEGVCV